MYVKARKKKQSVELLIFLADKNTTSSSSSTVEDNTDRQIDEDKIKLQRAFKFLGLTD